MRRHRMPEIARENQHQARPRKDLDVIAAAHGGEVGIEARIVQHQDAIAEFKIILVGAGQHQLTGLAHEASHHILFKNRLCNDLASDWLCMFPLFGSTQHYRLQHIAHHQFVNDPDRDPDVGQGEQSWAVLADPEGNEFCVLAEYG